MSARPDLQVYFAKCVGMEGPIKIGCSRFPAERAVALAAWAPFPIEILAVTPGNFKLERRLHAHFADLHVHHEWFKPGHGLLEMIGALNAGRSINDLIDMQAKMGPVPNARRKTPEEKKHLSDLMNAFWNERRAMGLPWRTA